MKGCDPEHAWVEGVEVSKERDMNTGFLRLNSQNNEELEGVTGDSFIFSCKIGI